MAEKIVEFYKWCSKCEHRNVAEADEPCNECLTYPVNYDSKRPVNYKEAKNDSSKTHKGGKE